MIKEYNSIRFNLTYDLVFKKVFSNIDILNSLLNALLDIKITSDDIVINNSEDSPSIIELKTSRYDIKVTISNYYKLNLEMQRFNRNYDYIDRAVFYLSRLISNGITKGAEYGEKEYVQISFVNFSINKDKCIKTYAFKDEIGETISKYKIIIFDLTKIDKCDNLKVQKWLRLMVSNNPQSLKGEDTIMNKAIEEIERINKNENEMAILESQYKAELDYEIGLVIAEKKGKKLGSNETKKSIAIKMFKDGLSKELITKYLDLSIDELNKLLEDN